MTRESLVNRDWTHIVARLGGATHLEVSARETKAFLRARAVENAVDLLRMIFAYCLGARGYEAQLRGRAPSALSTSPMSPCFTGCDNVVIGSPCLLAKLWLLKRPRQAHPPR